MKANVVETLARFLATNPGFRAAIVNFDLNRNELTLFALEAFRPRLVTGGVFVFDEYGINEWTESDGVDLLAQENGLKIYRTNYFAPSAYIQKT